MKTTIFDVLIVYSGKNAISADTAENKIVAPFYNNLNIFYGYFLQTCRKNNLNAALTTSVDIVGPGRCRSYWLFKDNHWFKVKKIGYSRLIFDKLSPINRQYRASRKLLFSSEEVRPFNQPDLFQLFFDCFFRGC